MILEPLYRLVGYFLNARFARFIVFGGIAAVVNLTIGHLIYSSPRLSTFVPYWFAVAFGTACGMIVNFGLNYIYNFRYFGRGPISQLRTFVIVALGGVALTAVGADLLLDLAHLSGIGATLKLGAIQVSAAFAAHVLAVGLVTFYSFAAHSAFSFNEGLRAGLRRVWNRRRL